MGWLGSLVLSRQPLRRRKNWNLLSHPPCVDSLVNTYNNNTISLTNMYTPNNFLLIKITRVILFHMKPITMRNLLTNFPSLCRRGFNYVDCTSGREIRLPSQKMGVLGKTLKSTWRWEALKNEEHLLVDIISRSTLTQSGRTCKGLKYGSNWPV